MSKIFVGLKCYCLFYVFFSFKNLGKIIEFGWVYFEIFFFFYLINVIFGRLVYFVFNFRYE